MPNLDRKFYKTRFVPQGFAEVIQKSVNDGVLPNDTILILNSLINGKSNFKSDLEDILKKDNHNKGVTNTSAHGILSKIIQLGDNISSVRGYHDNFLKDGLEQLHDVVFIDGDVADQNKQINYNGNLPSVYDTKKLKQIEFNRNGGKIRFDDDLFQSILNTDKVTSKYITAIKNGDTSLNDNFSSEIGVLYTLFKNIKRRSDSVKNALNTVKSSNFKGDNGNLFTIKKIDSINNDELQDRKTVLNISGQIHQLIKGAKVTIPEFTIDNKNFLYYKRNTFDLFIDESRRMSFQFLSYNNPDSINKWDSYKIECRIGSEVYKNCEIYIQDLGIKEKQMTSSAFPVVDAYNEFTTIFNRYNDIRDAYISSN